MKIVDEDTLANSIIDDSELSGTTPVVEQIPGQPQESEQRKVHKVTPEMLERNFTYPINKLLHGIARRVLNQPTDEEFTDQEIEDLRIPESIKDTIEWYLPDIPVGNPLFGLIVKIGAYIATIGEKMRNRPKKSKEQKKSIETPPPPRTGEPNQGAQVGQP